MRSTIIALSCALLIASVQAASRPEIVINTSSPMRVIPKTVFGANHRYDELARGTFDVESREVHPAFVDAVRESGIGMMRFPAGTIGNLYRWKRAVGDPDERPDNANGKDDGWYGTWSNDFGPDEFGRLLDQVDAEGSIVVNFATGSAREAADWVEYMNAPVGTNPGDGTPWADVRARHGRPEPYDVMHWEVGNEPHFSDQRYWLKPAADDAEKLADLYANGGVTRFETPDRVVRFDRFAPDAALSSGTASQVFFARYPPVVFGSQTLFVDGEEWREADDLTFESGVAAVYLFDARTGRITFGDGERGDIPTTGAVITMSYDSGPHDGYVAFREAMKAVDPRVNVYASLMTEEFYAAMGERPIDGVVKHLYPGGKRVIGDDIDRHDRNIVWPRQLVTGNVLADRLTLREAVGSRAPRFPLTEFGIGIKSVDAKNDTQVNSVSAALGHALFARYLTESGIDISLKHMLVNYRHHPSDIIARLGPDEYTPSAIGLAMGAFSRLADTRMLPCWVRRNPDGPEFRDDVHGALQVMSGLDKYGALVIAVANVDPYRNIVTNVRPLGFEARPKATRWRLTAPEMTSWNGPGSTDTVTLNRDAPKVENTPFAEVFPASSITVLRLSPSAIFEPTELLADDFAGQSIGSPPQGWTAAGKGRAMIVASMDGGRDMRLECRSRRSGSVEAPITSDEDSVLRVTARVRCLRGGSALSVGFLDKEGHRVAGCALGAPTSRRLGFTEDDAFIEAPHATFAEEWRDVTIVVDQKAGLYQAWVDDVKVFLEQARPIHGDAKSITKVAIESHGSLEGATQFDVARVTVTESP